MLSSTLGLGPRTNLEWRRVANAVSQSQRGAPYAERAFELLLPPIDHSAVPSYLLARRAHWAILAGFALLCGVALALSLLVTIDLTIAASGAIEPATIWSVRSREAGVIVAIAARTGERVARDSTVAVLDRFASDGRTHELRLQAREQASALERAARALPLALNEQRERIAVLESDVLRARALFRERSVQMSVVGSADSILATYVPGSRTQMDIAYADVRSAEAELRAGRLGLARARTDSLDLTRRRYELARLEEEIRRSRLQADRLTIVAPADGVVLTDQLERRIGEQVQVGEQVLEIAELDRWRVLLHVSERDVHDVRTGQPVAVEIPALEALDGKPLQGRVTAVAPQPVPSGQTSAGSSAAASSAGTFRVVVALEPGELARVGTGAFRRGYAVRARVVTRSGRIARLLVAEVRDWVAQRRWW